ncbi:TPA: hypothetical protein ACFRHE_001169 [Neisseria lactamica]
MNANFAVNNIGNKKYRSHSQHFPDGVARVPLYERSREFRTTASKIRCFEAMPSEGSFRRHRLKMRHTQI